MCKGQRKLTKITEKSSDAREVVKRKAMHKRIVGSRIDENVIGTGPT